jgi:hypothetical protein
MPDAEHLVLTAPGATLKLRRLDEKKAFPLTGRGFHFVNEFPLNN